MLIETRTYMNTCNCNDSVGYVQGSPNPSGNPSIPSLYITSNVLQAMPMVTEVNGNWGPISWDVDYNIDVEDLKKSYFKVKVSVFGFSIINTTIDEDNPDVSVDLTVSGVGIIATLGADINNRRLYLKGSLNFIVYTTEFDITLLKF